MKVFISWSGDLSHKVAVTFREWLPMVIQSIDPYVSSEDIDKGTRWSIDVAKELEDSSYGIICITPNNVAAPWVNFEAGALSKSVEKNRVSPFLFGVKRSEVQGPLVQFQSTIFEKADVLKLLKSINSASQPPCLEDARLENIFNVFWAQLEGSLKALEVDSTKQGPHTQKEAKQEQKALILEEILELVRQQQRILNDPMALLPPNYLEGVIGRSELSTRELEALMDVRNAWRSLLKFVNNVCNEDVMPPAAVVELTELVEKIGPPLEYLFSRNIRAVDRARRRRALSQGEADTPNLLATLAKSAIR